MMNHTHSAHTRSIHRAFTLIELLVVISIIALLIAVLLPVLGSARESGLLLQCKSNIGQVGKAQMSYQADAGRYAPIWIAGTGEVSSDFLGYMQAQVQDLEDPASALNCVKVEQDEIDAVTAAAPNGVGVASYGLNPGIVSQPEWDYDPIKVPVPSQYILVAEQPVESSDLAVTAEGYMRQENPFYSEDPGVPDYAKEPYIWTQSASHDAKRGYRHGKQAANAAFNDGHVEFLSHEELSMTGTNNTTLPTWKKDFAQSRWVWWTFIQDDGLMASTAGCGCGQPSSGSSPF